MRSKNIKEIAFRLGIYAGAILGIILMCWNNENNIYYFYLSLLGEIWLFVLIAVFAKKQYVKVMLMVGIIFLIAGKFGLHYYKEGLISMLSVISFSLPIIPAIMGLKDLLTQLAKYVEEDLKQIAEYN